jgi:hypothetical protein
MLGVGKTMVGAFLSSGLLGDPVAGVQAHPLVRRQAIEDLLSNFEALAREQTSPSLPAFGRPGAHRAPLVTLLQYAVTGTATLPALVRDAIRSGVAPVDVDKDAVGLHRFLFQPEQVRHLADRSREAEGWATSAYVRRQLRCQWADIGRLVAAGFLAAEPSNRQKGTYRRWRISSTSIANFVAEYSMLAVLCHASGEHPKRVSARLRKAGVEPVAVEGARVPTMYRTADLAPLPDLASPSDVCRA